MTERTDTPSNAYSGKNPRCAEGCPEDTRCDYEACPWRSALIARLREASEFLRDKTGLKRNRMGNLVSLYDEAADALEGRKRG